MTFKLQDFRKGDLVRLEHHHWPEWICEILNIGGKFVTLEVRDLGRDHKIRVTPQKIGEIVEAADGKRKIGSEV
jgi:hypothetical protein